MQVTNNPQFEDLTYLRTGGYLTFKLSRITGVGEFELECVLSSPGVKVESNRVTQHRVLGSKLLMCDANLIETNSNLWSLIYFSCPMKSG